MRHIGILKPDTLVTLLNRLGLPVALIYFVSMFIYPWFDGHADWHHVQNVWDRWQGLNIGMLAFISSITAFNISRFNANKQRKRDFLATKAFLPNSLSELCDYFNSSASLLQQAWELTEGNKLEAEMPLLPESYKEVFGNCIRHAESDVGDYLSNILVKLQIHNSRLKSLVDSRSTSYKLNIISYIYSLGELQGLVNKLFEFARNMGEFDSSPLEWEDFRNSFSMWFTFYEDFSVSEEMNLEAFTKRAIDRNNG